MTLHDKDKAVKFDTRKECQEWIDARVVRFKLRMVKMRMPAKPLPNEADTYEYIPKKTDGKIINTLAEDFAPSGTDEPLGNYAEPVQSDGKWMAVMKVR